MGWFSSKSKSERNNNAYSKGFETYRKETTLDHAAQSLARGFFPAKNSEERAFKDGYREAARREVVGEHTKKSK